MNDKDNIQLSAVEDHDIDASAARTVAAAFFSYFDIRRWAMGVGL
jgi:hypothetical protein